MTKKKEAVEPQPPLTQSFKLQPAELATLAEMARVTGIAKSSIIRNALYEAMAKWEQTRGAKNV